MKIMSYNILGMRRGKYGAPKWKYRKENLKRVLNELLKNREIDVICMQEVNYLNLKIVKIIFQKHQYQVLKLFPMQAFLKRQYNLIAVKIDSNLKVNDIHAIPHLKNSKYKSYFFQLGYIGRSEYRTTVFAKIEKNNQKYMIGNTHTEYKSDKIKERGLIRSLETLENNNDYFGILVGDMNTFITSKNKEYLNSLNKKYQISYDVDRGDLTFFRYDGAKKGTLDFAFVDERIRKNIDIKVIKQSSLSLEPSDHRPIIITIEEEIK